MLVIRVELSDVFHELFDRKGFHVICGKETVFRVTQDTSIKQATPVRDR